MGVLEKIASLRGKFHTAVDLARREFWDKYQDKGTRTDYEVAFYGLGWTNKRFFPYYTLGTEDNPIELASRMFSASKIRDVGTLVLADECEVSEMFAYSLVKTAHIHILGAIYECEDMFLRADSLENLTFEGTIYGDLNIQWSYDLTEDSLRSIVNALQDLYEDGEEFNYSVTFSGDSMQLLQDTGLITILDEKGWDY